ncbi:MULTISPECIES: CHAT domain-containing protein [unclassified Coleofasciculus]|uniref:CHAT domain-containing protein n=1 Tax=unclassified Coleofasciculus TaxID=2692782 RepID=UPI0018807A94|nr:MULTISPECIES: CHAT domain-containing protein [unclassified Coleofasciculus]MBE9127016.1 CHAT domain-containing protein [Coleofasciculus sp. LEGE 07081]MBE9149123.1 CHAT domain-containing protein [Coleofasciculus sp. LEGE 07092]
MELLNVYLSTIDEVHFKVIVESDIAGGDDTDSKLPFFETSDRWRTTLIKALEVNEFRTSAFPEEAEREWMAQQGWLSSDRQSFHPSMLARIGQSIYDALFPQGKVRDVLQRAISHAEVKETQLHVQLKFSSDVTKRSRLPDYPWELAHDGVKFLVHHQIRFSRYVAHVATVPKLPPIQQLKVLLVSSEASDEDNELPPLSKREQKAILKGLEKAQEEKHIQVDILEVASINHLRAYLTEHQPHVFHFDGHGFFGKRCNKDFCRTIHKDLSTSQCKSCGADLPEPQGYLLFETEEDEADYVSAIELGELLQKTGFGDQLNRQGGVGVAVLSACKSGMALGGDSVFNGLAQRLISHRLPAVVAMQYTVRVDSATQFAEQFYRSLGRKNALATAVSQGKEAMGAEGNQWYRPILYLRWQDHEGGQLFSLNESNLNNSQLLLTSPDPYLEWLIRYHNRLELRGVREIQGYPTVPLEKVYVALKGDRATSTERLNAYEALRREEQSTEEEWETLKANDFTKYQELRANIAVAQVAYREQKDRYDRLVEQQAIDLPIDHLPFKRALQQNPSLVERIKSNPTWLRLVIALYGGYYNYKAHEVLCEYRDIALFLQKPDKLREDEIARNREYYIGDFGADDTVYNAAVYLDVGMNGKLDKVKILPEFKVEAIYRDSPLTNRILSAIRKDESAKSLIPHLRNLWTSSKHSEQQADAFIALAALGEDVISVLENTPVASDKQKVFKLIFDKLSQLKEFLKDPITRALQVEVELPEPLIHPEKIKTKDGQDVTITSRCQIILSIESLTQSLQDLYWKDLLSTVVNLTLSYSNKPLEYITWDRHLTYLSKAYVNAEYWVCRFLGAGGGGDDFIYNCALALDKMAASSADLIVHSLALLHQTQNLTWSEYITSWFVEPLPPRFNPRSDIPLEVIDAIENINTEKLRPDLREALRSVFLDAIVPWVKISSDLLPEVLTLNLLNTSSSESVVQSLAPQIRNSYDKPARILEMINQVKDPYFRSRALLRLARYLPFRFGHLFNQSLEVARTINDPHLRCRVFEYLLPSIPTPSYNQILEETLLSARTILDPDDKARALARLSRFCLEGQRKSLLQDALLAATNIVDEYQKAETLQGLHQFLISYPDLLAESRAIAGQIADSWSRAKALGLRSPQLLQLHSQLQETLGGSVDLWSPLVLGTIVNDLLTYFNEATNLDGQWLALTTNSEQSKIANLYEAGIERGLTLTYTAVRTLDQLLNSGNEEIVRQFLPLLQDPTQDALPTIETWLNHWDENIANHAALFLSENERRLTPQTIDGLIALLNSREDRSRIRASLVLTGGIANLKREKRFFRTSELDSYVLDALGQAIHDYKNESPFVRKIIFSTQYDFIHDNPNLIEEWAKTLQSNEGNASAAEENLMGIAELTSESWQTFRQVFAAGNKQVRKAMTFALCWLALEDNTQTYTEDPGSWLKTLNIDGLEDICALPRVPCPIIQSSASALQQKRNNPEIDLIETAEEALKAYTITAAEALAVEADRVKDTLGKISISVTHWLGTGSIFKDASEKYAVLVEDELEIFSFLVDWLTKTLSVSVCNDGYSWKCTLLLADVAVYAERSPATFANLSSDFNLEPLLAEAVKKHDTVAGRVAAIQLISHLNKISANTLDALQQALLDDQYVRETAMGTLTRLQRVEGEVVDRLIERLYDQSATIAYTSARVLSLLGRSDKTKPQQRKYILMALADAVRSSQSQRGIYTISGTGADQESHLRLFYQGRLDQAFFQALLEVSGSL